MSSRGGWVLSLLLVRLAVQGHRVGAAGAAYQLDTTAAGRAQRGQTQLQVLKEEAKAHGDAGTALASCWATAVSRLESGCRGMDDVTQSRLAVDFTNCHLGKSGLETFPCTSDMSVQACTQPMASASGLAFQVYTQFYTHTESICFYLQSQAFQDSTELAVNALHAGARDTADRLQTLQQQAADIGGRTSEILEVQVAAAAAQKDLLQGQRESRDELAGLQRAQASAFADAHLALEGLGAQSRSALEELKRDTTELSMKQRSLLGGVDRLLGLQDALLGEFLGEKPAAASCCVGAQESLTCPTTSHAPPLPSPHPPNTTSNPARRHRVRQTQRASSSLRAPSSSPLR